MKDGHARLEEAIALAEGRTTGEIIVAHAPQAGRYNTERGWIAFAFSLALLTIGWVAFQGIGRSDWTDLPVLRLGLVMCLGLLVIGFTSGWFLCSLLPGLPILLSPRKKRIFNAEEAAILAFHSLHVSNTRAHTGVLIYIAEAERTAVVLGDGPIASKITAEEWQAIRDKIIGCIRSGSPVDGLVEAIGMSGELLARYFPAAGDQKDEIANHIVFLP